jgi:hypothetical protein
LEKEFPRIADLMSLAARDVTERQKVCAALARLRKAGWQGEP